MLEATNTGDAFAAVHNIDINYSAELYFPFTALVWVSLLGLQYICRMTFGHKRLSKQAS